MVIITHERGNEKLMIGDTMDGVVSAPLSAQLHLL